jgi:hypothetical protein
MRPAYTEGPDRLVLDSLADEKWDFRTIEGIAKETGLPKEEVLQTLDRLLPWGVRRSPVRDARGRSLYTLQSRKMKTPEKAALLRLVITKAR